MHLKNGHAEYNNTDKMLQKHGDVIYNRDGKMFSPALCLFARLSSYLISTCFPFLSLSLYSHSHSLCLAKSKLIVFWANHVIWAVLLRDLHFKLRHQNSNASAWLVCGVMSRWANGPIQQHRFSCCICRYNIMNSNRDYCRWI